MFYNNRTIKNSDKSFCPQFYCKRMTEWGNGAKLWFIICIIGGIIGLLSLIKMKDKLKNNRTYQIYTACSGKDALSPMIFLIQCLYITGYFVLLTSKNKLGWFIIIIYFVMYVNYLFKNDIISFTTFLSACINPLITGLILRKYWSDLRSPSQLFNK